MQDSARDFISTASKISELDSIIYLFIQQMSIECLLSARHQAGYQRYSCEVDGQTPCPCGAYSLVKGVKMKQQHHKKGGKITRVSGSQHEGSRKRGGEGGERREVHVV